jgi:hypothetical protein
MHAFQYQSAFVTETTGSRFMREVRPSEFYSRMSVQDQMQFDRWLKANAVVASLFSALVVAMLFLGAQSSEPADTSPAAITTASKSKLLASDRTNWGKTYRRVYEARQRHMPNDQ